MGLELEIKEQPPPRTDNADQPDVWDLVVVDMRTRQADGLKKYGVPVRPDNGRDALVDAYFEVLDAAVYLRQEIERRRRGRKGE